MPLTRIEQFEFRLGQEAVLNQLPERRRIKMTLRHPAYYLDVAQAARAFFNIGLEVISGVIKAQMAIMLFFQLGFEKFA